MPGLRFAALGCVVGVFIARGIWMWAGWRLELTTALAVVVVAALAFVVQRLS